MSQFNSDEDIPDSPESPDSGAAASAEDFVPLSIELFLSGQNVPVDVYIKLSENKYVRLASKGEDLSRERLASYKHQDVGSLYLKKSDFAKYVGFGVQLATRLPKADKIDKARKIEFMSKIARLVAQEIYIQGVDKDTFKSASDFVRSATDILTDNADAMVLLDRMSSESDYLLVHSLSVSICGLLIARELGWSSPSMLVKVVLGGLLHDIGMKELDRGLVEKPRAARTSDEVKSYETHSTRGVQLLSRIGTVPAEIIQIAAQHHEDNIGQGFPMNCKRERIHPLARLVAVADQFCVMAMKGPEGPGQGTEATLSTLLIHHSNRLEPTFLVALLHCFDFPVPDRLKFLYEREIGHGGQKRKSA